MFVLEHSSFPQRPSFWGKLNCKLDPMLRSVSLLLSQYPVTDDEGKIVGTEALFLHSPFSSQSSTVII